MQSRIQKTKGNCHLNNFKFNQELLFRNLVEVKTIICKCMVSTNFLRFDSVRHNIFVEILALSADLRLRQEELLPRLAEFINL